MMVAKQNPRLFVMLLGTLAFSLSALPGLTKGAEGTRAMASVSSDTISDVGDESDGLPDFESEMHSSPTGAHKSFNTKVGESVNVKTTVNVTKGVVHQHDYLAANPDLPDKNVLHVEMTLETECSTCYTGRKKETIKRDLELSDLSNLNGYINTLIREKVDKLAKPELEAQAKAKEIKEKNAKIAACDIPKESERLDCNVDRMAKVDDVKAAEVFQKQVRPLLSAMISSSDMSQRLRAKTLIDKVKQNGAGGEYVKEQIAVLEHVQTSKATEDVLSAQLKALPANSPMALPIIQAMQTNSSQSQQYFSQLASYNAANPFSTGGTFDYTSSFGMDIAAYQTQLNTSFQAILAAQMAYTQQMASQNLLGTNNNFQFNQQQALANQQRFNAAYGLNNTGTGTGTPTTIGASNMNVAPMATMMNTSFVH